MWLCGMIKLRTTNLLCLIASYIGYWQIHPPQKWIIYDNLYFPALCHSTQKDQEPGRRVKMPSLLSMLSRPQLTESLCTALVLSLLPAVSEIIPHVPGRISDGAWKWLSCTAGWWSEREGKKGFLGEKASNGKTIFCTYFLNSPATLGVYYGVTVGTAIPSWAPAIFCTLKLLTESSEPFLWPARDRFYCGGSIDGSETWERAIAKSLRKHSRNHALTLLVMFSAHMLFPPLIFMGYLQCSSYLQRGG